MGEEDAAQRAFGALLEDGRRPKGCLPPKKAFWGRPDGIRKPWLPTSAAPRSICSEKYLSQSPVVRRICHFPTAGRRRQPCPILGTAHLVSSEFSLWLCNHVFSSRGFDPQDDPMEFCQQIWLEIFSCDNPLRWEEPRSLATLKSSPGKGWLKTGSVAGRNRYKICHEIYIYGPGSKPFLGG